VANPSESRCILAEAIDATSAAVTCQAYFTGKYRYADIVFATSTAAQKKAAILALQDRGILVDVDFSEIEATT
jgi:Na+-translocating ferredoxin:NAD+ oxidoreductase RnfD subunit